MGRFRRGFSIGVCLCVCLSLCACLSPSIDSLYSLPQIPKQYLHLEALVEDEISRGSEYSAPTLGSYRQSIQFYDLDRDGVDEALAFFRDAGGRSYVIIYREQGGGYAPAVTIQGEGSGIGGVEYSDLSGDGLTDLVIEWQQGSGPRLLSVYSLRGWAEEKLYTAASSGFQVMDLAGDGSRELLIIQSGAEGYSLMEARFFGETEPQVSSAPLSADIDTLDRVRGASLEDGSPALFVEGKTSDSLYFTDIFVFQNGRLLNLTRDKTSGASLTLRPCQIYSADIGGDRHLEVPLCEALPRETEDAPVYWLYNWYSYDISGRGVLEATTYHCDSDGWYLTIPQSLRGALRIRRDDSVAGERRVILSAAQGTELRDIAVIYTLTGDNRRDRAAFAGRFVLDEENSVIYAAQPLVPSSDAPPGLDESGLRANFSLIVSEWDVGSLVA